jgi:1-acyl-sn-glycerol-3-phosphate acyltransferase
LFYTFAKVLFVFIFRLTLKVEVHGTENVPDDGKLVVCGNHQSNWDPLAIAAFFPRKISWMGKKELFENKILKTIVTWLGVFPVDRQIADVSAVKTALRILKDDRVLGIFPEGTRVSGYDPANAKSGVALLSMRANAPVLPVYVRSQYKLFSKLEIFIGKPENYAEQFPGKHDNEKYEEISQVILAKIYALGG